MPLGETHFENFGNDWLQMKETRGLIEDLYNKWILGKEAAQIKLRWSIGRDVFGLWK